MMLASFQGFKERYTFIDGFGDEAGQGSDTPGKTLNVLLCFRPLHVNYGLDFFRVCLDPSLTYHEAKELIGRYIEGELCWVKSHSVVFQYAEHDGKVMQMFFCCPTLYQHIIDIHFHDATNVFLAKIRLTSL